MPLIVVLSLKSFCECRVEVQWVQVGLGGRAGQGEVLPSLKAPVQVIGIVDELKNKKKTQFLFFLQKFLFLFDLYLSDTK